VRFTCASVGIVALAIARKCRHMCPFIDGEISDHASRVVVYNNVVKDGEFGLNFH
jgi:hypothetical protein